MNKTNTRGLVEAALMAVLTVGLVFLGNFPPLMMLLFITAVPIAVLTARHGLPYGLGGAVVSGLLLMMFSDPITAMIGMLTAALPAVAMGEAFRLKHNVSVIILISTVFFAAGFAGNVMLLTPASMGNPVEVIEKTYTQFVKDLDTASKVASIPEQKLTILKSELAYSKELTIILIPSLVVLVGFFMAIANVIVTRLILRRSGYALPASNKFRYFRLPESLVSGLLIIFILTFVTGYFGYIDTDAIYTNIVFLFSFLFAFQGVAVFTYFCFAIKGKDVFKVGFVILAIAINATGVFALIGMLDAAFNIRKFYENSKTER